MGWRSERLHRLVLLAEAEERQIGALTRRAQSHLSEQTRRLGELNAFRQQYAQNCPGTALLTSAHLKDRQVFALRLDQAVRAQQRIVEDCGRNVEIHRQQWRLKRQRVESLTRARSRFETEERLHSQRSEQRSLDDLPARIDFYEKPD